MSLQHYGENTSIHFKDIQSNKEDFLEAKDNLDLLLRRSPCGSKCRLQVRISGKIFKGKLEIKAAEKSFQIEGEAVTVRDLQRSLFKQINKQLNQWKQGRSLEDLTGSIKLESFYLEKKKEKRKS